MKITPDSHYEENKAAYKAKAKQWKLDNPEKVTLSNKKNFLKRTYGMSFETYTQMYETQGGLCGICECPLDFMGLRENHMKSACVDHCHTTQQIRGLLCRNCNLGIGHFEDNLASLEKAIAYLKRY